MNSLVIINVKKKAKTKAKFWQECQPLKNLAIY